MKYPKEVCTQGETIRFKRRKPNAGELATWHRAGREIHVTGKPFPSGDLAVKTFYKALIEGGVDLTGMDIRGDYIQTLAAIVTDGFVALMKAQD